jgi:hypothetical protein
MVLFKVDLHSDVGPWTLNDVSFRKVPQMEFVSKRLKTETSSSLLRVDLSKPLF